MQVIRAGSDHPIPDVGSVVTVGAYDGVHLGHQAVIAEVRRRAETAGLRSAVVTFDRHPAMVVRPESAPRLLTDLDQKLKLLASAGVDVVYVIHFDESRAAESAEDFVKEVLVDALAAKAVVVGADFHFGHNRSGNVAILTEMGSRLGFEVEGLDLRSASDVGAEAAALWAAAESAAPEGTELKVSSTSIRAALVAGEIKVATALLGRPHEVRGLVTPGDQRGRDLGFPTANLAVPGEVLMPKDGIYAGWYVRPSGEVFPTAINLGRRPTFYEQAHASLLEAHVLDFEGDLYGEHASVLFVARLHGEIKYASIEALVDGIAADCQEVRNILDV